MTIYHYFIAGEISPDTLIIAIQAQPTLSDFAYLDSEMDIVDDVTGFSVDVAFFTELSIEAQGILDGVITAYGLAAPLQIAKAKKILKIQTDINNFLESHYSFLIRTQLFNLYVLAKFDSLTNRAAYIRPGINWVSSIVNYGFSLFSTVNAMTDPTTINAFTYDISTTVGSDPGITLAGALAIST